MTMTSSITKIIARMMRRIAHQGVFDPVLPT